MNMLSSQYNSILIVPTSHFECGREVMEWSWVVVSSQGVVLASGVSDTVPTAARLASSAWEGFVRTDKEVS